MSQVKINEAYGKTVPRQPFLQKQNGKRINLYSAIGMRPDAGCLE